MIIVEQGAIVDACGGRVRVRQIQPSQACSSASPARWATASRSRSSAWALRFLLRRRHGQDQRVYFFNAAEIVGNKYGTAQPVPFRVVDANIGLDVDISVRCNGEVLHKIVDSLMF